MDYKENYKEKYNKLVEAIKVLQETNPSDEGIQNWVNDNVPELAESQDEKVREWVYNYFRGCFPTWIHPDITCGEILAWLEKQGKCETDCHHNHQDANYPNGCIVLEDFNGGEGFYKVHLDYLNKKQVEEIEEMIKTWNKDSKVPNENIKSCIGMCLTDVCEQRFRDYNTSLKDCLAWLEKQGTPNQVSIWKHWKDGICGNGEGKPIYLIKAGNTYNLSSCLGFECDYIELSELDNLMLKKQGEQKISWKPTDGQIEALKEACDKSWEPDGLDPLYTLYQDLEKLKGE